MRIRLSVLCMFVAVCVASAQEFNSVPRTWKWIDNDNVVFTYDGSYEDSLAFSINARSGRKTEGVKAPEKFSDFPVKPQGAVNMTYSPDMTKIAYTKDNDLYVVDIASREETRLTFDGSDVILNGYASWVYYEEIFGRPSKYKAFWWAPDGSKIAFYRFDNSDVPMFPIYSAFANPEGAASQSQSPKVTDFGVGGSISETRYPKAGQANPIVKIGVVDIQTPNHDVTWADFDSDLDQYFGPPFWSPDSREFFVPRMPRLQNTLDLYAVSVFDGSKRHVYNETYKTWLNWIYSAVFTEEGLYMVREFETDWQQVYFLSYDGTRFKRLTEGPNWDVNIVRVDEKKGDVFFTAKREAYAKQALYRADSSGEITALTDTSYNAVAVKFSPDGKYFAAAYSNVTTPTKVGVFPSYGKKLRQPVVVADMQGPDFDPSDYALGQLVYMTTSDGFKLPGMMVYPKDFDPSKKYPVHVDIYGGPNIPYVRDRWVRPRSSNQWWSENGIIQITVDPRAAGHNGRKALDMVYRQLTKYEVQDFCEWADWLKSLPYVDGDKIGVEGFSFGGTMTCMLLMQAPDKFHYGVAGGGVYDWSLYDSHYTERYMDTPQNNPEGYELARVLNFVDGYPCGYEDRSFAGAQDDKSVILNDSSVILNEVKNPSIDPVMLKITHGTGDDNVHHQNTLLLIDALHKAGKKFEFMIYPDGMHGYDGYQGRHFEISNQEFWKKYLLGD